MSRVVLIDTGLVDSYEDKRIIGGCSVVESDDGFKIIDGFTDRIGHGTAAAHIILKYSINTEIYVVRIYEEDLYIDEEKLIFALTYVRDNLEFDIIQISSGILTYSCKLHDLIRRVVNEDNKLIISAFDNEGGMSYPAALPEVVGIDVEPNYRKKEEFDICEDGTVDIRGGSVYFRVPWITEKKNIVNGTSFLTGYFTALIGDSCSGAYDKCSVIGFLKEKAINVYGAYDKCDRISAPEFVKGIGRAIAFPFNKEIYCLAAFEDMLPFKIMGYYDIKHKFLIGKKVNEVLAYTDNEAVINNVDNIDWDGDFDTVILGHLGEISSITQKDYLKLMLDLCREHRKQVYIFDDMGLIFKDYYNTRSVFSPVIPDVSNIRHFGKLRICNVPVLAIMGTSSRQGKYTIQLNILREFRKRGIKVDGIATEPTGALFGFSEMFACGYGSNNYLSSQDTIKTLNELVFELEKQGNELIITGGQSGTIAYDIRNESLIPYDQYAFLIGTNPDGVILCVNEVDDMIYIEKTVNFIEAVTNAKVFAFVISSARSADAEKIEGFEMKLKDKFGNKTYYRLNDLNAASLVDDIMNYYE